MCVCPAARLLNNIPNIYMYFVLCKFYYKIISQFIQAALYIRIYVCYTAACECVYNYILASWLPHASL